MFKFLVDNLWVKNPLVNDLLINNLLSDNLRVDNFQIELSGKNFAYDDNKSGDLRRAPTNPGGKYTETLIKLSVSVSVSVSLSLYLETLLQ